MGAVAGQWQHFVLQYMLQLCTRTRGKQDAEIFSGQLSQPDINVQMHSSTN